MKMFLYGFVVAIIFHTVVTSIEIGLITLREKFGNHEEDLK